jgi:hypothetical protein
MVDAVFHVQGSMHNTNQEKDSIHPQQQQQPADVGNMQRGVLVCQHLTKVTAAGAYFHTVHAQQLLLCVLMSDQVRLMVEAHKGTQGVPSHKGCTAELRAPKV